MITEQAFMDLEARITALEKMNLMEWSEIKNDQLSLSMRINTLSTEVSTLLKEVQMLMGTLDEVQAGSGVAIPTGTPSLKAVLDTLLKVSSQLSALNMRLTTLEETTLSAKKA